ncbi:inorganic phosphate transporter, putative [Bodo saltans]|uniref:Inorganic phosphate transporter, putative n=1 Tax=Bodo saltans TaxID=75058 RepID=A0A0S4IKD4_BODSA|nr:inorganic phosphate transporter, putative [Bodo saltans]|eukprot:CUF06311.1 inorganic phosphate transporter, putative [Bodo saltans]
MDDKWIMETPETHDDNIRTECASTHEVASGVIDNLDEVSPARRKPNSALDKFIHTAKLGAGLFADSYDLFVIDSVLAILNEVRGLSTEQEQAQLGITDSSKGAVAAATSFGAVAGMLIFGFLSDRLGRRKLLVVTAACVAIGALACAVIVQPNDSITMSSQLVIFRVVVGIGIGGEYPLSAAATLETPGSDNSIIHKMLRAARLFCMQGGGMVTAAVVALMLIAAGCPLDYAWRILLGLGAIPALVAVYTRVQHMEETEGFTRNVEQGQESTLPATPVLEQLLKMKSVVLTTCSLWFLLDITFYGTAQFRSAIESKLFDDGPTAGGSPQDRLVHVTAFSLIVALAGLPGYLLSAHYVLKRFDVWLVQLAGFSALVFLYIGIGFLVDLNAPVVLSLVVFAFTFFVTNLGPNMTTFIIPPMMFPTNIRTTGHGIAAASGKLGAAIGSYLLPVFLHEYGLAAVMYFCGGVALVGMLVCMASLRVREICIWRESHRCLT